MQSVVIFVENRMVGAQHLQINASMVDVFVKLFPNRRCCLLSDKSVQNSLFEAGTAFDDFIQIKVYKQGQNLKKFFTDFLSWIKIFPVMRNMTGNDVIVFLSLFPTSYLMIRLLSRFVKCQVFVVCHGEIALLKSRCLNPFKPAFWLRLGFSIPSESQTVNYIFLGQHIDIPLQLKGDRVLKVNHPARFDIASHEEKWNSIKPLNIGLIGTASRVKNTHLFFHIARMHKNTSFLNFAVSGSCDSSVSEYRFDGVDADFSGAFVAEEISVAKIKSFDVALFFYDENLSGFASGAFIDAIRYEIPILALKNSYFDWLKLQGIEVALLFDSIEEMSNYLSRKNNILDLRGKFDFSRARDFFSVDTAVEIIKNELSSFS